MHPREIAYYNPPSRLDAASIRGGAPYFDVLVGTRTKDSVATQIRWATDPKTGERERWFISGENGFQVVKFTNGVYPLDASAVAARTDRQVAGGWRGELGRGEAALAGLGVLCGLTAAAAMSRRRRLVAA
jgi:hypothetical protein